MPYFTGFHRSLPQIDLPYGISSLRCTCPLTLNIYPWDYRVKSFVVINKQILPEVPCFDMVGATAHWRMQRDIWYRDKYRFHERSRHKLSSAEHQLQLCLSTMQQYYHSRHLATTNRSRVVSCTGKLAGKWVKCSNVYKTGYFQHQSWQMSFRKRGQRGSSYNIWKLGVEASRTGAKTMSFRSKPRTPELLFHLPESGGDRESGRLLVGPCLMSGNNFLFHMPILDRRIR